MRPVDDTNWQAVATLTVAPQQKGFIESNQLSLLEAAYDQSAGWHPFGLYRGEQLVGFTMIGSFHQSENYLWLDRFMIGAEFQGQGLGQRFVPLILTVIRLQYGPLRVYLSAHEANTQIFSFYQKLGFQDTKKHDPENGERIMFYDFTN